MDHTYFDRPGFVPDFNGAIGVVPVKETPPAPPGVDFPREVSPELPEDGLGLDEVAVTQSRIRRAVSCGDNHACAYDLRMTGSDAVAEATLDTQEVVAQAKQRALIGECFNFYTSAYEFKYFACNCPNLRAN